MVKHKKDLRLPGGESNPGLPRDRRDTYHYTTEDVAPYAVYVLFS